MTAFLWVLFICYCIQLVMTLYRLGKNEYPRVEYKDSGWDVYVLIITLIMGGWTTWLLFL